MQKGGFDIIPIKDSDFKYTQDPDRILWTKNVFPIAEYIIQAIQNIPWSTYTFEGISAFWSNTEAVFQREDIQVKTNAPTSLYFYFGGSVYEIMNGLYDRPGLPDLHSYVDPTGDLDVMIMLPNLTFPAGQSSKDYLAYFFNQLPQNMKKNQGTRKNRKVFFKGGNYNNNLENTNENKNNNENNNQNANENQNAVEPLETVGCTNNIFTGANATQGSIKRDSRRYCSLVEHYTDWIMDHFAKHLKQYMHGGLFELLFGNTVKFNIENDSEGRYADRIICIGNLKLVRSYLPYMGLIKIQLIAKFQNMTRSDHICEFLLSMPNQPSVNHTLKKYLEIDYNYHVLKGFPLSNFGELVRGNLDSLINRYSLYNTELRHKFYNHVGRMQYLHDFFKNNLNPYSEQDSKKLTLSKKEYMELGKYLTKFCFYIAENFFSTDIFYFDGKKQFRANMSPSEMTELRKNIVKSLIGSYPTFLLKKGTNGKYKSPFQSISFVKGEAIPARTEFILSELFDSVGSLPDSIRRQVKVYNDINIIQLFMILKYLHVISF